MPFLIVQLNFLVGFLFRAGVPPADFLIALVCFSLVPRDSNPGWGDWRRSSGFLGLCLVCLDSWTIFKSVRFAFLATRLDAVQRLEQKKSS